jgi:hypothetical protein
MLWLPQVFDSVCELVQSALDGYHVCLFSYGQTGAGKTFTMSGGPTPEQQGIMPRAVQQVRACTGSAFQGLRCCTQALSSWSYQPVHLWAPSARVDADVAHRRLLLLLLLLPAAAAADPGVCCAAHGAGVAVHSDGFLY